LPLILSTGMSDFDELDRAVGMIRTGGCEFALLQCTSIYPAPVEEIHLRSMAFLSRRYECLVGFSDHSQGILLAPVAVALGATIVEKHLTLDRTARGSDHTSSVEPQEMARLVASIRQVEAALGRADKPVADGARIQRDKLGRSLVTRVPIARGTIVEESMLTLKCPGDGLGWSDRDQVVGRTAQRDLPADEMLRADDIA
jgi:sialic acid synthase SpsE